MKQIKCTAGNKLCGKRCVPMIYKCKEEKEQEQKPKLSFDKVKIPLAVTIALGAGIAAYFAFRTFDLKTFKKKVTKAVARVALDRFRPRDTLAYFEIDEKNLRPCDIFKDYSDKLVEHIDNLDTPEDKSFIEAIEKASKPYTIKEFESKFSVKINPELRSKFNGDESVIMVIDGNSRAWHMLKEGSNVEADAMYNPYFKKVIIPDTFTLSSEKLKNTGHTLSTMLSHELLHLVQYSRGEWHYTDEEYIQRMKNLTPIQSLILDSVNKSYDRAWAKMIPQFKELGIKMDRAALQRTEFEAYLATSDWEAMERLYYEVNTFNA